MRLFFRRNLSIPCYGTDGFLSSEGLSVPSGASRVRTGDPLLAKQMRYQLRHSPVNVKELQLRKECVGLGGLEPPTSSLSGMRSNQLSYRPIPCDSGESHK